MASRLMVSGLPPISLATSFAHSLDNREVYETSQGGRRPGTVPATNAIRTLTAVQRAA